MLATGNEARSLKVPVVVQLVTACICSVHLSSRPQSVERWEDLIHHMMAILLANTFKYIATTMCTVQLQQCMHTNIHECLILLVLGHVLVAPQAHFPSCSFQLLLMLLLLLLIPPPSNYTYV